MRHCCTRKKKLSIPKILGASSGLFMAVYVNENPFSVPESSEKNLRQSLFPADIMRSLGISVPQNTE